MPDYTHRPLNKIFTRVTPRYDLINRLFTLRLDERWRKKATRAILRDNPRKIMDLCTGTGDLAVQIARMSGNKAEITGYDYSQPMLELAVRIAVDRHRKGRAQLHRRRALPDQRAHLLVGVNAGGDDHRYALALDAEVAVDRGEPFEHGREVEARVAQFLDPGGAEVSAGIAWRLDHERIGQPFLAQPLLQDDRHATHVRQDGNQGDVRKLSLQTEKMIGAPELAALQKGAYFINIARGAVVDEAALVEALQTGHLAGAALDVFAEEPLPASSPLWTMPNVIVSPHSASTSDCENERLTDLFCDNLGRFLDGAPLRNVLNPELFY